MMKTLLTTCLLIILLSAGMSACVPLDQTAPRDGTGENEELSQRLREAQRQLKQLQEELAAAKARESVTTGVPAGTSSAWSALTEAESIPPGFGAYTFLLTDVKSTAARKSLTMVMQIIQSLPGRDDLPDNQKNRFLIPLQPHTLPNALPPEKYDHQIAADYFHRLNIPSTLNEQVLLATIFSPAEDHPSIIIDVTDVNEEELIAILPELDGSIPDIAEVNRSYAQFYFWKILSALEPNPVIVQRVDDILVLKP